MVDFNVKVEMDNGVVMMTPLDGGKWEGGPRDVKVGGMEPIYFDPLRKMVDNDPRELMDMKEWFEKAWDREEYFVDDEDDFANLGGTFGELIEFTKKLKSAVSRSIKSAYAELEFLGEEKEGCGEGVKMVKWFEESMGELDELVDVRRSGIINFEDMHPETLKQKAEGLKKLWLVDMVIGGVIRRYMQFMDFERAYSEYIKNTYKEVEGHRAWREKRWNSAQQNLARSLKGGEQSGLG